MASTDTDNAAAALKHDDVKPLHGNGNGNDEGSLNIIAEEPESPSSNNAGGMVDVEKHGVGAKSAQAPTLALKRKLKSRHLQMIAIGTIILVSIDEHPR